MSLLLWTSVSVAAMTPTAFETTLFADQPPVALSVAEMSDAQPAPMQTAAAEQEIVPPPVVRTLPPASNGGATPGTDIVVTGERRGLAPDPLRSVNETAFKATQAIDDAITGPAARAYKKTLPREVRKGIHNFLYNFREPVVFVNFLLQHKIGKAAETFARFAINTTAGVAGIFDVAKKKPFKLPRRSNGFANTLGFYGVPNGPFLFLPITGPTTLRDLFGGAIDRLILPFTYGSRVTKPAFVIPFATLSVLDHRSEFDGTLKKLHDNAADPYANSRTFYLQRRQAEIDALKRGQPLVGGMTEPPKDVDERGRPIRDEDAITPPPVVRTITKPAPAADPPRDTGSEALTPAPSAANDNAGAKTDGAETAADRAPAA
ncbi:MlaA family lipoprotein [Sphingomonas sp. Mn802worker]|uniref:MlaA family lipoprotein n=1 Tax=Sphingomonas sp. Mn802worker TaxID=629773 RepID=UPI000366A388|nr:VacJ family lipoprotein [Sphingomonas sp. Mn802worker]